MTEILTGAMCILSYIGEGLCLKRLCNAFSRPRRGHWAAICHIASQTLFYIALPSDSEHAALFKLALYTLLTLSFSLCIFRGKPLQRIFAGTEFLALRELSVHTVTCLTWLNVLFGKAAEQLVYKGIIPIESTERVFAFFSLGVTAVTLLAKTGLIYYVTVLLTGEPSPRPTEKEAGIYMLPAAAGLCISAIIRLIFIETENGYTVTVYSRYPLTGLMVPMAALFLLALTVMTYTNGRDMKKMQAELSERRILEIGIEQLSRSAEETKRHYEEIRTFRHDMKNSMAVLKGLISAKLPGDKEIERYFEDMHPIYEEYNAIHTGDPVADTVINGKFHHAREKVPDIALNAENFIAPCSGIGAYDLGIILSNGIDNAVEACIRLKEENPAARAYITVSSFTRKNMYFAEIENSFEGELITDEEGFPISQKEDPDLHGIGLSSIRRCAEKYSGGIDIRTEGGKFTLCVMLKSISE